jgi:DNA-binding response OmpR family regulator
MIDRVEYLSKPFGIRELYARFRAVQRRRENGRSLRRSDVERGGYKYGGWRLDRRTRRLIDPRERPVTLSKSEYALLVAFLDAPERPLSREYLLQATRLHEDIFDRSMMFRCCGCGASWRQIRMRHASLKPNAALAMCSRCLSNHFRKG